MADHFGPMNPRETLPIVPLGPYHGFRADSQTTLCGRPLRLDHILADKLWTSYPPTLWCHECSATLENT